MAKFNLEPLGERVVIKPLEEQETTVSGIVIPDTAKEKPTVGDVVAVGPGALDEKGQRIPIDVKVGDRVLFSKWAGSSDEYKAPDGEDYLILKASEIWAIVKK